MSGVAHQYPQIVDVLNQHILPEKAEKFYKVDTQCLLSNLIDYRGEDFFTWTTNGDGFLRDPRTVQVVNENTLGISPDQIPNMPLYMYHSNRDEVAPVSSVNFLYNSYCSRGVSINYQKSLISDHITQMIEGAAGAFVWLVDRLNGKPIQNHCTTTTTYFGGMLLPKSLAVFGSIIAKDLLGLLGKPIGPPY